MERKGLPVPCGARALLSNITPSAAKRGGAVEEIEAVVVGAGVIGLAAARALALAGREVVVLEKAYTIGFETSSRNSEVIHGGLYYRLEGKPEGDRLRRGPPSRLYDYFAASMACRTRRSAS